MDDRMRLIEPFDWAKMGDRIGRFFFLFVSKHLILSTCPEKHRNTLERAAHAEWFELILSIVYCDDFGGFAHVLWSSSGQLCVKTCEFAY